jgi:hypothetical protein
MVPPSGLDAMRMGMQDRASHFPMKTFVAAMFLCLLALIGRSQESDTVQFDFTKTEVKYPLFFYERLTGKPVFARLDVHALVTIQASKPIPRAEAIDLIRKTLLERYGIELSTTERGETLVAWSKDPAYPRRSDEPAPVKKADSDSRIRKRIRTIR